MIKYIVTFELEVTATDPAAGIRTAHRRMVEVIARQADAPHEVWNASFDPEAGTAHATGQPRVGRIAGWRCITSIKAKS